MKRAAEPRKRYYKRKRITFDDLSSSCSDDEEYRVQRAHRAVRERARLQEVRDVAGLSTSTAAVRSSLPRGALDIGDEDHLNVDIGFFHDHRPAAVRDDDAVQPLLPAQRPLINPDSDEHSGYCSVCTMYTRSGTFIHFHVHERVPVRLRGPPRLSPRSIE